MKKAILSVLMLMACNVSAGTATGSVPKHLTPDQQKNIYCAGYAQGVYKDATPGTGSEKEAGAAVAFFYQELADQGLDDPDEGAGGANTKELDAGWEKGFNDYQRTTNVELPKKCRNEYFKAVRVMTDSELSEPYTK